MQTSEHIDHRNNNAFIVLETLDASILSPEIVQKCISKRIDDFLVYSKKLFFFKIRNDNCYKIKIKEAEIKWSVIGKITRQFSYNST